jgi:hypothetical protein
MDVVLQCLNKSCVKGKGFGYFAYYFISSTAKITFGGLFLEECCK